jgi:hypothetical protein
VGEAEPAVRYVVSRYRWWWWKWKAQYRRMPGAVAVASFATFAEADAERARREAESRAKVNPFTCGGAVHHWTHLDEPRLRDWLMDHGIDPPAAKNGTTDWAEWWKKNNKKLGAEKCAAVWEVLDKVRFYTVREQPVRPVGYAVVGVNWEYNDEYYDAHPESAHLVKVYRSRDRAEAECARQNEEARAEWAFMGEGEVEDFDPERGNPAFDMHDWLCRRRGLMGRADLKRGEGRYPTTAGVPFFEVIEVELEGLE